jgi:hypothetical protein
MFDGGSWWQPPPHALFELGMPIQLYDTAYVPTKKRRAAGSIFFKENLVEKPGTNEDGVCPLQGNEEDDDDEEEDGI